MRHLIGIIVLSLFLGLANGLTYSIDTKNEPISIVSESFLSVGMEIVDLLWEPTANLSNPRFAKLLKHLAPVYLKVGGARTDLFQFYDDTNVPLNDTANYLRFLVASRWTELNKFVQEANARLIFSLNSQIRFISWNKTNAEELVKFSRDNRFELDWELGNEPDLYNRFTTGLVAPDQLGEDYGTLRSLLDKYGYNSSYLVGPDVSDVNFPKSRKYLFDFLALGSSHIHAATWHQYDAFDEDQGEDNYLNPAVFNLDFKYYPNLIKNLVGSGIKVWLDQATPAFDRETNMLPDRYIASFLFADKLGLGAQIGLDVIVRDSIWSSDYYGMLDSEYNPNPDWWVSVLYKKLVGTKVVSLTNDGETTRTIRLYAHCGKPNALWGDNAVVVFGVNVANNTGSFNISEDFEAANKVYYYEMTSGEDTLQTKKVRLNGAILKLSEDLNLPEIDPQIIEFSNSYSMSSYSIGFWVFTDTNVKACQ